MNAVKPPTSPPAGGTPAPVTATPASTHGRSAPPLATEMLDVHAPVAQVGTPAPRAVVTPAPSTAAYAVQPNPQDVLIGQTLADRYYVQKKLGEGGMGAVYLATHKVLEKQVALKVLHGEFARKQDLVERFMQEAKAASRIRHENVIDVSDFGSTPDGLVFFAMELLNGHDLHEEIARARIASQLLPWARTKRIFLQICSALSAAHGLGIVHRDLKPENVFLVEFLGDTDFVKLLDFGIAKLTEVNEEGRKLTRTGMLFGTPEYMSPEQARGDTADHRVDIYAMGCILFQLITTRVPFEADNFMGVLSLHLTEPPPQISSETFDAVGAPRELMRIIDRALAKDRNDRFQTIDDLANAVRVASGDAPVGPRGPRGSRGTSEQSAIPAIAAPPATTTQRPRTQWTGAPKVPESEGEPRPPGTMPPQHSSKMPIIIGAAVLVAGAAIAAAVVFSGGKPPPPAPPGPASGSQAAVVTPPLPGAVDAGVVGPPLPKDVTVLIDSKPTKAEVRDVSGTLLGYTPWRHLYTGDRNGMQFVLHLHGYSDVVVNADLDKPTFQPPTVLLAKGSDIAHLTPVPVGPGSGKPAAGAVDAGVPVTIPAPLSLDAAAVAVPPPIPLDAAAPVVHPLPPCVPDPLGGCMKQMPTDMGSAAATP